MMQATNWKGDSLLNCINEKGLPKIYSVKANNKPKRQVMSS